MDILLEAKNLGRKDHGHWRLQGFSLQLQANEIVGLLGVNGAGKSTALALLSGTLAPTCGQVSVLGKDLHQQAMQCKKHIGLLPEQPTLYPELTVDENLNYAARLNGVKAVADARSTAKSQCDLKSVGHKLAGKLSKGFQQRVGIAQAIIHQPKILILDEPTAGLDPAQAAALRALISKLSATCSVILASHILLDIEQLCQRVIVLHDAQVRQDHDLTQVQKTQVKIQLLTPPADINLLCQLPGVSKVQTQKNNWYLLDIAQEDSLLAQKIADQQWGLGAFMPVNFDLQTLFISETQQ